MSPWHNTNNFGFSYLLYGQCELVHEGSWETAEWKGRGWWERSDSYPSRWGVVVLTAWLPPVLAFINWFDVCSSLLCKAVGYTETSFLLFSAEFDPLLIIIFMMVNLWNCYPIPKWSDTIRIPYRPNWWIFLVDNSTVMVGSYGPQKDLREWKSETYTAPKGAMHRGTYNVKSRFRDIDKNDFITWKWAINVVKSPTSTD